MEEKRAAVAANAEVPHFQGAEEPAETGSDFSHPSLVWQVIRMFMGEYNHTIDAKGRLIVPSKFRELLGDEFVATKGLDGCLFVYPAEEWKVIEEKFRSVSQFSKDARKFARFFFAGAAVCEVDKQGRILLPAVLREFAGLEKDVVLAGVLNHIEIWSKDRWNATSQYDDVEEIAEHMAELGISI